MKQLLFVVFILFVWGCQKNDEKNIIDRHTYKNILKEIILTNIVTKELKIHDSLDKNWLSIVYQKYNIDSLKLAKTTTYYSQHPDELYKIYSEIYLDLKQTSDSLEKIQPKPKALNEKIQIPKEVLSEKRKNAR